MQEFVFKFEFSLKIITLHMRNLLLIFFITVGTALSAQQVKIYQMPDDVLITESAYKMVEDQILAQGAKVLVYDSLTVNDTMVYKVGIKPTMGNRPNPYQKFQDQIGQEFPEKLFGLKDIDKPRFVNFWFTSCMPCIKEIPDLNELKEEYSDTVDFVAITFNTQQQVDKFLEQRPIDYQHITGQQAALSQYGVRSYPMNMLLDKDGKILWVEGMLNYTKWEVEMLLGKLLKN